MELIKFDAKRCSLCGKCVEKCPFGALSFEDNGIVVGDTCRMCGMCVRQCPEKAISFEQKAGSFDKDKWKDFLIFVEQERGDIHPVVFELIGEARKMASKVNFKVKCVIAGGAGTIENAHSRLLYRCCCRMYRSTETKFCLDRSNSTRKIISPKTGNKIPYRINS